MKKKKRSSKRNSVLTLTLILSSVLLLRSQSSSPERDIRGVMEAQQAAWNRGDVAGFMSGYEASDATTFVGVSITRGYKQVLENYERRYPTRENMGRLTFADLEVKPLGAEYASVIGKWHLARSINAGGDVSGIFTLLFRKTTAGWKIILDHTS
jgi:ketosteroid isomerase-like protein